MASCRTEAWHLGALQQPCTPLCACPKGAGTPIPVLWKRQPPAAACYWLGAALQPCTAAEPTRTAQGAHAPVLAGQPSPCLLQPSLTSHGFLCTLPGQLQLHFRSGGHLRVMLHGRWACTMVTKGLCRVPACGSLQRCELAATRIWA